MTKSLKEIAHLLGFKPSAVSYILYRIPEKDKYIEFEIPKNNGGVRKIKAPTEKLKHLQRRLADLLNECFDEICNVKKNRKSLSHGFRKQHSIITNATNHKNRRYVFNIDLQDFFPSLNFGRVRGFFIKNKNLKLVPEVATIVAQIACHNNELPQGSPCSPVISNLLGHLLDIRMVNLAKKTKCTYSRYADDLTFSTNMKSFPEKIALMNHDNDWIVGESLKKEIEKLGFSINAQKTSMQYKTTRQMTTGLIVNKKINIKKEYYRKARSMCHELFKTGKFYISKETSLLEFEENDFGESDEGNGTLNQLEGILSFIYQVKHPHYLLDKKGKKGPPTAITKLYRKFLFYKHFFSLEKPLVICEGKTDIIYLKCALKSLKKEYEDFFQKNHDGAIEPKIRFLNQSKNFSDIIGFSKGASGLKYFIIDYEKYMKIYKVGGKKHPVILLLDNDDGSNEIKGILKTKLGIKVNTKEHYRFAENLFIFFVPMKKTGEIEDLFDKKLLDTKLKGKKFNSANKIDIKSEYSKQVFAESVVKVKQKEINFNNFKQVFDKIKLIIKEYGEIPHN